MRSHHDGPRDESWRKDAGFFGRPILLFGIILGLVLLLGGLVWWIFTRTWGQW